MAEVRLPPLRSRGNGALAKAEVQASVLLAHGDRTASHPRSRQSLPPPPPPPSAAPSPVAVVPAELAPPQLV